VSEVRIRDLTDPVTAAKADWLPGTTWIGFTPSSSEPHAASQCEATIYRQMKDGYVLEYVTHSIEHPNRGFEGDPEYLHVANEHPKLAGRLIAVHRLRPTMRPSPEILGHKEFDHLQDMWAQDGKRRRWSVAFPIIESFEIEGKPPATEVLSPVAYKRLFQHSSGTLRPLNDEERGMIADLVLVPKNAINAWIAIEDEIRMAEGSLIPDDLVRGYQSGPRSDGARHHCADRQSYISSDGDYCLSRLTDLSFPFFSHTLHRRRRERLDDGGELVVQWGHGPSSYH
jgi:5-methylcytosine-specific restriction protein A